MIQWRKSRALAIAAVVAAAVGAVLVFTAWNTRRADYRDCLRAAAAIRPGQSRAGVLAFLSPHQLTRNEDRHVVAICHPTIRDAGLPYYPVKAIEIDVYFDDRAHVTGVTTNDVLVWRKRYRD